MKQHLKALLETRNALALEVNTEGTSILEAKSEADKLHKDDCPCKKGIEHRGECTSTEYVAAMGEIAKRVETQKTKRTEILSLDELIEEGREISETIIKEGTPVLDLNGPVTEHGMMGGIASHLADRQNKGKFLEQVGNDFYGFLHDQLKLRKKEDIKSRATIGTDVTRYGDKFNRVASFHAIFGTSQQKATEATKSISEELGLSTEFHDAMKTRREASMKSMFTQHPLAGGDGSLYAPTEVFAGNTGGLCEYIIDDTLDVLPYAPVSFLDCIPVRQISKPYVLYVRQTLRINNASGVGESVVLTEDNPTGIAVDFRPLKPESEFGFSQAKAYTITFADTLPVSEEFLEDCPAIADAVQTQLLENVRQEYYDQVLNGDGSDGEYPEIVGLLSQIGLSTRVHRGAASFFGNVMGAGAVDDNVRETIERAIFDAQAYGYSVDCVIISHDDMIEMTFLKDEDGHRLYSEAEVGTIKGAKIRADVRMPAGTAIAGAFAQTTQLLIRRGIRLDIGWIDKQFRQDMLTLRATMRAGLLVKVPHALIRITGL